MNEVIIVNMRGSPVYVGRLRFVSGRNRIDAKVFDKLKDDKGFQFFLDAKFLQVLEPRVEKPQNIPLSPATGIVVDRRLPKEQPKVRNKIVEKSKKLIGKAAQDVINQRANDKRDTIQKAIDDKVAAEKAAVQAEVDQKIADEEFVNSPDQQAADLNPYANCDLEDHSEADHALEDHAFEQQDFDNKLKNRNRRGRHHRNQ